MRLWTLQILRAIAAIAVVFSHIYAWEHSYLKPYAVSPEFFGNGVNGVSLFFVISGFIMVYIEPFPIRSLKSYLRFLIHRVTRIYPPLWLVLIPLTVVWIFKPQLFNNIYDNHVDIVRCFLLLPQDYGSILTPAWTLIHEVYFYMAVSIPLMLGMRGRWIYGILWFLVVLVIFLKFGHTNFYNNRTLQVVFSPFSLTFLLGYFIGLSYVHIKKMPWQSAVILIGLGVAYYFILPLLVSRPGAISAPYPNNNSLFNFVRVGIPSALVVIGALALERQSSNKLAFLVAMGDASYAIYLVHLPIITGAYRLLQALKIHNQVFLAFWVVFLTAVCLALSWLFHIYLEKPVTGVCRRYFEAKLGVNSGKRPSVPVSS